MNLVFCKNNFVDSDMWLTLLELSGVDVEHIDDDDYSEVVINYDSIEAN